MDNVFSGKLYIFGWFQSISFLSSTCQGKAAILNKPIQFQLKMLLFSAMGKALRVVCPGTGSPRNLTCQISAAVAVLSCHLQRQRLNRPHPLQILRPLHPQQVNYNVLRVFKELKVFRTYNVFSPMSPPFLSKGYVNDKITKTTYYSPTS